MKIIRELVIKKPIEDVWEVLGNQFADISKWSSLISSSEVSGESKMTNVSYSIRSTETANGPTKQELTAFDPANHMLSYKAISGTPAFFKSVHAEWALTSSGQDATILMLDFEVKFKGITGILSPIVKKKLGKVGDELLEDFQYYVENGTPHPRKTASK